MTLDQVLKKINSFHCNLVEITGGEPLLQGSTLDLISTLLKKKFQVLLETNGSKSIQNIHPDCIKIMDIKCPSSNEPNSFLRENIEFLHPQDEIKFVIGSKKDYDFATDIIQNRLAGIPSKNIHLSPVFGQITPKAIADWMLKDNLAARLSLQQHKIIWNPEKRGV